MKDPDGYASTLGAQGWYRTKDGRLTHPAVEVLLRWWRGLDPTFKAMLVEESERRK